MDYMIVVFELMKNFVMNNLVLIFVLILEYISDGILLKYINCNVGELVKVFSDFSIRIMFR